MRRNRKQKRRKPGVLVAAVILLVAGIKIKSFAPALPFSADYEKIVHFASRELSDDKVNLNDLYSPYAVLMDAESGNVLAEKSGTAKMYPASLTKIMTAIVALENTDDMEEMTIIPSDIFPALYEEDASLAGFAPGETVRWKDLLYGALLPSGAECCLTFAGQIAGCALPVWPE